MFVAQSNNCYVDMTLLRRKIIIRKLKYQATFITVPHSALLRDCFPRV